jgi:hypothetical protein
MVHVRDKEARYKDSLFNTIHNKFISFTTSIPLPFLKTTGNGMAQEFHADSFMRKLR